MTDLAETRDVTLQSSRPSERAVQVIAGWLAEKSGSPVEATTEGAVDLGSRFAMAPFGTRPCTDVTFGLTRLITLIGA